MNMNICVLYIPNKYKYHIYTQNIIATLGISINSKMMKYTLDKNNYFIIGITISTRCKRV